MGIAIHSINFEFNSRYENVKYLSGQGEHNNQQDGWGYFVTRFEVDKFANSISTAKKLPLWYCKKCFKS